MDHQIIDNCLNQEDFDKIQKLLLSHHFPWHYGAGVSTILDESDVFYFIHTFYEKFEIKSSFIDILNPIIKILNPKALIRIKANLYPNLGKFIKNGVHTDTDYKHKGAIFYINDNNGCTILESGTKIESKKNRLLLFDSSKPHQSTHCTNSNIRVNININYF
jgi:hypothetical protein